MRRENMDKPNRAKLLREDDREERELRAYVASSVASEMISSFPGAIPQPDTRPEVLKSLAEREQEAAAAAGENVPWMGHGSSNPDGR